LGTRRSLVTAVAITATINTISSTHAVSRASLLTHSVAESQWVRTIDGTRVSGNGLLALRSTGNSSSTDLNIKYGIASRSLAGVLEAETSAGSLSTFAQTTVKALAIKSDTIDFSRTKSSIGLST